jgi:hypothetical protein
LYEEFCFLGYDAVVHQKSTDVLRNLSTPPSGMKNKPSKKLANRAALLAAYNGVDSRNT